MASACRPKACIRLFYWADTHSEYGFQILTILGAYYEDWQIGTMEPDSS